MRASSPEELGALLVAVNNSGLEPTDDALPDLGERLGFPVQRKAPPPALDPELNPNLTGEKGRAKDAKGGDKEEPPTKDSEPVSAAGAAPRAPHSLPIDPSPERVAAITAAYKGAMAPFRQIILESSSREECLMKLARAYADWKPERLVAQLEEAMQLAAAAGAARAAK